MNSEDRYIVSCYGLPADMMRVHMVKEGFGEVECHTAGEIQAMLEDGYKVVTKNSAN